MDQIGYIDYKIEGKQAQAYGIGIYSYMNKLLSHYLGTGELVEKPEVT